MNKHYLWADIAKGFCIILVVAGHSFNPAGAVCKAIYLFHLPMFFVLSGYFFNFEKYENNFLLLLKKSAQRLLLPAFVATLIFYKCSFKILPSLLYGIGMEQFGITPIGYAIWFLLCLFVTRIFLWLFLKTEKRFNFNKFVSFAILWIIVLLGCTIGKKIYLPWSIDIAMVALYFSYAGYLLKQKDFINFKTIYKTVIIALALILFYIDFRYFGLSLNNRYYSNPVISVNSAVFISFLFMYLSLLLEKLNNNKVFSKINIILEYLGVNTILIMLVHIIPHSSINAVVNTLFRLSVSAFIVEIVARIPIAKDIFCAKSLTSFIGKNKQDGGG